MILTILKLWNERMINSDNLPNFTHSKQTMKKTLLLLILAIGLVSCEITERVYLNENGSVKYETEFDFSQMSGFMFPEAKRDSLRKIGEFPIDTIMAIADLENYSDMENDSISDAEREFMQSLDKMRVRMKIDENVAMMNIGLEEKDVESFNDYLKKVKDAGEKLAKEDPESAKSLTQSGILKTLELKYDGKQFQRISGETGNLFDELDDSTSASAKEMLGMFKYRMEYHFPKKIKSSTLENATFSLDGKTMTIDVPMNELMENPQKYNFTVEFE
jgi:hypothetical protein